MLCIFISSTECSAVQALGKFSTVQTARAKPTICRNPISALQAKTEQSIQGASWDMECSCVALSSPLLFPIAKFYPLLPSRLFRLKPLSHTSRCPPGPTSVAFGFSKVSFQFLD